MTYEIDIAGLKRELPLCPVSDDLLIGAFVIFGDVELTVHCAAELLKRAPEYDYLIAPEAKAIPLLYEMARQSGANKYFLARKKPKAYMTGVLEVKVQSITTAGEQTLVLDTADAEQMRGKRILILDDVISTSESLHVCPAPRRARGRHHRRPHGDPRGRRRRQARGHHHPRPPAAVQRGRDPQAVNKMQSLPCREGLFFYPKP